jgi:hypothetical protein
MRDGDVAVLEGLWLCSVLAARAIPYIHKTKNKEQSVNF